MQGYEVRTIDDDMIGHVAADDGDFLIVEHGRLMKTKHALPKAFAEVDADEKVVRTTLSKELIDDSPKVNGELDRVAIAEHYGLVEHFAAEPTSDGDDPDEIAYPDDESLREEVEPPRVVAANEGPFDDPAGHVLGGSDETRPRDYDGD
jgi:hypothetical protein